MHIYMYMCTSMSMKVYIEHFMYWFMFAYLFTDLLQRKRSQSISSSGGCTRLQSGVENLATNPSEEDQSSSPDSQLLP